MPPRKKKETVEVYDPLPTKSATDLVKIAVEADKKEDLQEVFTLVKPISLLDRSILEAYALGKSEKTIASELGISVKNVKNVVYRPENAKLLSDMVTSLNNMVKARSIAVLSSIIEDKLSNYEGNAADMTKKDVVDVIMSLDSLNKEREKKELGTAGGDTYVNILTNLINGGT